MSPKGILCRDLVLTALPGLALFLFPQHLLGDSDPMDALPVVSGVLLATGLLAGAAFRTTAGIAAWGAFAGMALGMFVGAMGPDGGANLWPLSLGFMALLAQVARLGAWLGGRLRGAQSSAGPA